jgi:HK97 family phage major capsid protein
MPYEIKEKDGKYCVHKEGEAEPMKCYESKQEAEDYQRALYTNADKSLDDTSSVSFGEAVKSLDNGRIGGYLVRFTSADNPDLTGDFFSKDTDFDTEFPTQKSAYYNHGMDAKIGKRKLGKVDLKEDEIGIWAEMQLQAHDDYEKFIGDMAKAGKLGWSSGSASHLIEKEAVGKSNKITKWVLVEASLTPTPAEYRNTVVSLKSLMSVDKQADELKQRPEDAKDASVNAEVKQAEKQTEIKMTDEIKKELEVKTPEPVDVKATINEAVKVAVEEFKKSLPALDKKEYSTTKVDEKPFKSLGEQLQAVLSVATRSATDVQINKLDAVKATGLSENVPSDGGFLVQSDFSAELLKPVYELGAIASRVDKTTVSANSNGMTFNAIDESSRAAGSRFGGIRGYWLEEAGTKTSSKPTFRKVELKLKKLIGLCYATDELLQDAAALQSVITEGFANEFTFQVEDAIYNGDGIGKPLGVMGSACLVTVSAESGQDAATINFDNIVKMWARMAGPFRRDAVWCINQDIEPQLFGMSMAVGTGGIPVYLPPNGLSAQPYGTLFGRPVLPVEYAATLGTTGDILLANFSAYKMIDKGGTQSASSIHAQFTTDETAFRFVYRCDGVAKWKSALTPFKGSNTVSPFVALATRS